ncbi:VWA domain-containing protein [Actinoallomurus acanthiterrae]
MGKLTRLTDLAQRAGRWLGLSAPPALHTQAIESDRFDQRSWRETLAAATALQELSEELAQDHDYAGELLTDVWTAAYKSVPQLRGAEVMQPSRRVNHQVIASLLKAPEFEELSRETTGDAFAAAMAVMGQRDRLIRLLRTAEDAQAAADKAEQARQAAEQAAQQVEAAMRAAADQASPDGAVKEDHAQAVEQAIAAVEQADHAAQDTADQAQRALAQIAPRIRTTLRAAAAEAAEQVRQHAEMMAAWGVGRGELRRMDFATRHRLAERLSGGRLGEFADLIGRFRTMACGERTRKIESTAGELVGITLGDDVSRLIPSELASLGVPALRTTFATRLVENRLMIYESRCEQATGKGAIIACVDCSGSMTAAGPGGVTREAWAKACALALLDQARAARRDFAGVLFAGADQVAVFDFPATQPVAISDVADFAEHFFSGVTDYAAPLDMATGILENQYKAAGHQHGDIVFITDGICDVPAKWIRSWQERKRRLGFRVFGVAIGHHPGSALKALSDDLRSVTDLADPGTAREMFRVI